MITYRYFNVRYFHANSEISDISWELFSRFEGKSATTTNRPKISDIPWDYFRGLIESKCFVRECNFAWFEIKFAITTKISDIKIYSDTKLLRFSSADPDDCLFDSQGMCFWKDESPSSGYRWTRIKGRTPSGNTGPDNDHTTDKTTKDGI